MLLDTTAGAKEKVRIQLTAGLVSGLSRLNKDGARLVGRETAGAPASYDCLGGAVTFGAFKPNGDIPTWWDHNRSVGPPNGSSLMMDAEALERLEEFVVGHGLCEEHAISTEFVEDRDSGGIRVIKRCQACNALVLATLTKGAAKALLRQ